MENIGTVQVLALIYLGSYKSANCTKDCSKEIKVSITVATGGTAAIKNIWKSNIHKCKVMKYQ